MRIAFPDRIGGGLHFWRNSIRFLRLWLLFGG